MEPNTTNFLKGKAYWSDSKLQGSQTMDQICHFLQKPVDNLHEM